METKVSATLSVACLLALAALVTAHGRPHGHDGPARQHRPPPRVDTRPPSPPQRRQPPPVPRDEVNDLSETDIIGKISVLVNEGTAEELIQFLSAFSTLEGREVSRNLGVDKETIDTLIEKLGGTEAEVAQVKATIQAFIQSIVQIRPNGSDCSIVRQLYKVYNSFKVRQMAKQLIQNASLEEITAHLQTLAQAESLGWLSGTTFTDFFKVITSSGEQGLAEVKEKMLKWVEEADCKTLSLVRQIYMQSATTVTPPTSTTTPTAPTNPTSSTTAPRVLDP